TLAVHAALPLIKAAYDVVLLTVGDSTRVRGPSLEQVQRWLARHGVDARAKRIDPAEERSALLEHARAEGADDLRAGAYTRVCLRELVFGGATEDLITKTDMPVLLMHA